MSAAAPVPFPFPILNARQVRAPTDYFRCEALAACLSATACVKRQQMGERMTRANQNRGRVPYYPSCSERCLDGSRIRRRLNGKVAGPWIVRWGPGAFLRGRRS
jgi:hypothetical protein